MLVRIDGSLLGLGALRVPKARDKATCDIFFV